VIHALKRRLHRDIVADPVLHGRVLNLYLNGEQYPQRVQDYFPMAGVEDPVLEERMREHLREEDKHVALYTKAIRELEQPVRELPLGEVYNTVIRRHTPAPDPAVHPDGRRLALGHFLAHLHWLESRVAQSLEYHVEACAHAASPYPAKAVQVILHDERAHAAYTREAVFAVLPQRLARTVLATHRKAEARANLEFSAAELRRLLGEEGWRFSRAGGLVYGGCAALMQRGALHG
jgi:hypothetical protein